MHTDTETIARAVRLRGMTRRMLAEKTPAERDRMLQRHLAQARGPARNALLLRQMTAMLVRAHRAAQDTESDNVRRSDG